MMAVTLSGLLLYPVSGQDLAQGGYSVSTY